LREPNLGKTNLRVSLTYSLGICFSPSLADPIIFLTLTRLVVVFIFVNFSFALFTPPSRRLSVTIEKMDEVQEEIAKLFQNKLGVSLSNLGHPYKR
jgi:hypothetical protein